MEELKVAIIGQGRSGRDIHGASLAKMSDKYKIIAVVDELESRRKRAEQEYGCVTYDDYSALFQRDDLDLIVNAMPSQFHFPVTLDCLTHGFNVLCEKPLSRRVQEVDLLIKASEKYGKILAIFQQSRFSPAFIQLREVIKSGVLGRIVQVSIAYNGFSRRWDWQTFKERNGGNLLNTGPHPLDQALQLFGTDDMPNVTCVMDSANSFGDAEDYVKIILRKIGHPTIDLEISSCCAYPGFTYNVQGVLGGLRGSQSNLEWKFFRPDEAPEQHLIREPLQTAEGTPAYCSEQLRWYEESWDLPKERGQDLFDTMAGAYYTMLYKTIVIGEELVVTPQQVRQQIAVIEKCFQQNPAFSLD